MDESLIQKLRDLNSQANNGRGFEYLRSILAYLDRNDLESAKTVYTLDLDKVWHHDEIVAHLKAMFGCRLHCQHNCQRPFCKG